MGIFSNTDSMLDGAPVNVPMAEGYDNDEYSAQIAMIESYQNSFMIFDGVIRSDIQESAMRFQGVDEAEVMAFSEGVIGDLFNKIKEFFKKLWAKLKSIFHNFMARFDAKFGKSNKEFIKKYRKDIYGKDLSDFEVEYRKRTSNLMDFPDVLDEFKVHELYGKTETELDKISSNFDSNDYTCKWLEATCNNKISVSNPSEYDKEVMDYMFDESSKDTINLTAIIDDMMSFKEANKMIKKMSDSLNKTMSQLIKQIEKDQNEILKLLPGDKGAVKGFSRRTQYKYDIDQTTKQYSNATNDTKGDVNYNPNAGRDNDTDLNKNQVSSYQKSLNIIHQRAVCIQTVASKFTAVGLKAFKFNNSQNRRIIAKVIAYKRKEEAFAEEFADLIEWESDCVGIY